MFIDVSLAAPGLLAGRAGRQTKDPWHQHLLQARDLAGRTLPVRLFARVEFQDGTRKAPTQDYHGSGRPHVHVLVFASSDAMQAMSLADSVSATMPDSLPAGGVGEGDEVADILPGVVAGSQQDRNGRSGWPVQNNANHWNNKGQLELLHTEEDKAVGLRPYFQDIMEALRCHQDFQFADDDSALAAYVAKYVSKFSDSNQEEWLNDAADGNMIAATVLSRYKPFAPEMTLHMFGANFRQWLITTEHYGKLDFVVPTPDKEDMPKQVKLYLQAEWAAGQISLLDFLRKSNKDGKIINWLRELYKKRCLPDARTLEARQFFGIRKRIFFRCAWQVGSQSVSRAGLQPFDIMLFHVSQKSFIS